MNSLNYAIGRIKAIEVFLLDVDFMHKMLFAKDYESALANLAENKRWADIIKIADDPNNYLSILEIAQKNMLSLIKNLAGNLNEVNAWAYKYSEKVYHDDYIANLKMAAQKTRSKIFRDLVSAYEINTFVKMSLFNDIQPELVIQKISYCEFSKNLIKGIEEYKKNSQIAHFDKEADNLLMEIAKKAKYKSFDIDPVIGFFIAQETELKNLRLILASKKTGIVPEKIKNFVRETYV